MYITKEPSLNLSLGKGETLLSLKSLDFHSLHVITDLFVRMIN